MRLRRAGAGAGWAGRVEEGDGEEAGGEGGGEGAEGEGGAGGGGGGGGGAPEADLGGGAHEAPRHRVASDDAALLVAHGEAEVVAGAADRPSE